MKIANCKGISSWVIVIVAIAVVIIVFLLVQNPKKHGPIVPKPNVSDNGTTALDIIRLYKANFIDEIAIAGGLTYDSVFTMKGGNSSNTAFFTNYISPDGRERSEGSIEWKGKSGSGSSEFLMLSSPGAYQLYDKVGNRWILNDATEYPDSVLPIPRAGAWSMRRSLLGIGFEEEWLKNLGNLLQMGHKLEEGVPCGSELCTRIHIVEPKEREVELTMAFMEDGFCPLVRLRILNHTFTLENSNPVFSPVKTSTFEFV